MIGEIGGQVGGGKLNVTIYTCFCTYYYCYSYFVLGSGILCNIYTERVFMHYYSMLPLWLT